VLQQLYRNRACPVQQHPREAATILVLETQAVRYLSLILLAYAHALGAQTFHSADTTLPQPGLSLSELVRVVQLYNAGQLHCEPGSEDAFAPGAGAEDCAPHDADYAPADWSISLSELLRVIQLFNAGAYRCCIDGEDGFCPGMGEDTCSIEDTQAPVLTLTSPLTLPLECNATFSEPGFAAMDESDGDLSLAVTVDLSEVESVGPGIRTITYTVSDAAGNVATRTRKAFWLCDTPVAVPDAALDAAIREAIGKPAGDLLPANLAAPGFTELNAATLGVADLTGLAYAASLTSLDLQGNCIADIQAVSHLDALTRLNLHDNDIAEIGALRYLESLTLLWLGRNQIQGVTPLVENAGIAGSDDLEQWDRISLAFNPLNPEADGQLNALEVRGAAVWRPAPILQTKGAQPTLRTARVTLAIDDGDVYLTGIAEYDGASPLPEAPRRNDPYIVVRDDSRVQVHAALRFGLDVTSCGIDAPGGDSVGDFEQLSTAEISVALPVTGSLQRIDYHASPTASPVTLYPASKSLPKGLPCTPADEALDPIPIGARLVHGNPSLPDERAYVLLIMGDAFPEEELGNPRAPLAASNTHYIPYAEAVADSMNFFLAQEPFATFAPLLKVYRVDLVSRDNRPTDIGAEPDVIRDTALRMERKAVGFNYDQALCARVASNTGIAWNKIVLLPNGNGSGTQTANFIVYSNFSPSRKMTALHEFGHGMGDLADEYEYRHGTNPPESYEPADVVEPNSVARTLGLPTFDDIPWRHWLEDTASESCVPSSLGDAVDFECVADADTSCQCGPSPVDELGCVPLATCEPDGDFVAQDGKLYGRLAWPEPGAFPSVVGLFEGAKYRRKGAYRPELRCRMRSDDDVEPGQPETPLFCRVCRENLVARIIERSGNVANATPSPGTPLFLSPLDAPVQFSIVLHAPLEQEHAPIVNAWRVDGSPEDGAMGTTLQIDPGQLSLGDHTVEVETVCPTPWVHPNFIEGQASLRQVIAWQVTVQ
jgi:hypothetical protein